MITARANRIGICYRGSRFGADTKRKLFTSRRLRLSLAYDQYSPMVCQLTMSGIEKNRTWVLEEELAPVYDPECPPSIPQRAPTTDRIDFHAEVKKCPNVCSSYHVVYGKLQVDGHSISVVCKYVIGADRAVSIQKLRDEARYYTTLLVPLQGKDIPHFFGSYHGYLDPANADVHCLVLEYVGEPLGRVEFEDGFDADIL